MRQIRIPILMALNGKKYRRINMKKKKQPTDATLRNVRAAKKRNNVLTKRVFELEVEVRKLKERIDSLEAVQEHLLETVK